MVEHAIDASRVLERPLPEGHLFLKSAIEIFTRAMDHVGIKAVTEHCQIDGLDNLKKDGCLIAGPFLWLVKHESYHDVINLSRAYQRLPEKPVFKAMIRGDGKYFSNKALNAIVTPFLFTVGIPVQRLWAMEGLSEREKEELRRKNHELMELTRNNFYEGMSAAVTPEGTTKNDGRVNELMSGFYKLSKIEADDGAWEFIKMVPVGNTVDYMAGERWLGKRRERFFCNFGTPFTHPEIERHYDITESGARKYYESEEEIEEKYKRLVKKEARKKLIMLNTITASQLASQYIYWKAQNISYQEEGRKPLTVDHQRLSERVADCVSKIKTLNASLHDQDKERYAIDSDLLNVSSRITLIDCFIENLLERGYGRKGDSGIALEREALFDDTRGKDLKKYNPLLYMHNRFSQVLEQERDLERKLRIE